MSIMGYGCEADDRVEPEIVCPVRKGSHLWLAIGSHAHAAAEHGQMSDVACYSCHAYQPCRGTVGENRERSQS